MTSTDLLPIDNAAEAFGVSPETLMRRLDGGAVPEAVRRGGSWTVPSEALSTIAEREGWSLDLTEADPSAPPARSEPLDRYLKQTTAANTAVVLAKTQATAARAEAKDLADHVRKLNRELDALRHERELSAAELSRGQKQLAILERDRAVAEARVDELRSQVEQDRVERSLLAERIGALEADREEAITSMGWWSRRRYERRRQSRLTQPGRRTATNRSRVIATPVQAMPAPAGQK